jgi:elongation factor G
LFVTLEAHARNHIGLASELLRLSEAREALADCVDPGRDLFCLYGASETELYEHVTALRAACTFELKIGTPQVALVEKPMWPAECVHFPRDGIKQTFIRVKLILTPAPMAADLTFASRVFADASTPQTSIEAVENGVAAVAKRGTHGAYRVRGGEVILSELASDQSTSAEAIQQVASAALRDALRASVSALFEPLMTVVINTPKDYEGSVLGDLLGRRGQIIDRSVSGPALRIVAIVPLANMFGYAKQLRSFTQGYGTFSMQFDRYAQMPPAPSKTPPFRPAAALRVAYGSE